MSIARRLIRYIRDTLVIVSVTLLLLLMAEIAARLFFPEWQAKTAERTRIWRYDALLGWGMQANQSIAHRYQHGTITIQTNDAGLRDENYPIKRNNRKRLLVLGDSFVWGWGVAAEKRFTELLEARHPGWEVINAGMSGYSTDQEYLYYTERGHLFQPDAVLLLLYGNDYEGNTRDHIYSYSKPVYRIANDGTLALENVPVPESSMPEQIARYLSQDCLVLSHLWQAGHLIGLLAQKALGIPQAMPAPDAQARQITHRLIQQLALQLSEHNVAFILLSADLKPDQLAALDAFSQAHGITHIDLMPVLSGHIFRLPKDMHWNERGHALVAEAIDRHLQYSGQLAP